MTEASLTIPSPPRSPWQLLYGAGHRWRRHWYRDRAAVLPKPVVSIGNLHWGGTGKTPLVAAVARHLSQAGLRVAVLSRGYARKGTGIHVVSAGEGPLLGPRIAGDEPVALAGELPGVAVIVGADRYLAGRHALERLPQPPDCFVLDDGFSHLKLARDLDILVLPSTDPFGGGRLAPGGRLREPLASARDASAAVLSGFAESEPPAEAGNRLASELARFGFAGPGFASRTLELEIATERGESIPEKARVLLVTGIARPARFHESVARRGLEVLETLEFGDHHSYSDSDLGRIRALAETCEAQWVLTTTKDYVKLLGRLQAPLAHLPIRAEPEPAFWQWLDSEMEALTRGLPC